MTTLHLGVTNVAYTDPDEKGATTTGKVAEILEDKYHVMRVFVQLHEQLIGEEITKRYAALLNTQRISGGKVDLGADIMMPKLESAFRDYLGADEWQKTSGQVIAAAQNGVSHRFKKPKAKRGPRPAFIDTGLYSASFRSWIKS